MGDTLASLRRKIGGAGDLQSVVRAMKALAASNIGQYEQSVSALTHYFRTVELGLGVCFRENPPLKPMNKKMTPAAAETISAVVFGSDQGLVGQFNEEIADFTVRTLAPLPGRHRLLAVGERLQGLLEDRGLTIAGFFPVPNSLQAITPLAGQILLESEKNQSRRGITELHLFYNRPLSRSVFAPFHQRLLPLDDAWRSGLAKLPWPTIPLPEVIGGGMTALRALIGEYLFVSLFRACAESLASENSSRLAAMQRAERNIDQLLEDLKRHYHQLRQGGIDAELFDVLSGFESLGKARSAGSAVTPPESLDTIR